MLSSLMLDNEEIYCLCAKNLNNNIKRPSYDDLNRLIAMTASLWFEDEMNADLNELQTNSVPFPRLHFMTTPLGTSVNIMKNEKVMKMMHNQLMKKMKKKKNKIKVALCDVVFLILLLLFYSCFYVQQME